MELAMHEAVGSLCEVTNPGRSWREGLIVLQIALRCCVDAMNVQPHVWRHDSI